MRTVPASLSSQLQQPSEVSGQGLVQLSGSSHTPLQTCELLVLGIFFYLLQDTGEPKTAMIISGD